eukprot:4417568-Pyramimonas_sp.AAC.1
MEGWGREGGSGSAEAPLLHRHRHPPHPAPFHHLEQEGGDPREGEGVKRGRGGLEKGLEKVIGVGSW